MNFWKTIKTKTVGSGYLLPLTSSGSILILKSFLGYFAQLCQHLLLELMDHYIWCDHWWYVLGCIWGNHFAWIIFDSKLGRMKVKKMIIFSVSRCHLDLYNLSTYFLSVSLQTLKDNEFVLIKPRFDLYKSFLIFHYLLSY